MHKLIRRIRFAMTAVCMWTALCLVLTHPRLFADPGAAVNYSGASLGKAVAIDPTNGFLYLALNSSANPNFYIFPLNSDGSVNTTPSFSARYDYYATSMALDSLRHRLYLTHDNTKEALVLTLSGTGSSVASYAEFDHWNGALALALDAQKNRLYVGLNDSINGLGVITLDANGDVSAYVSYITDSAVYSLALDTARKKIYLGTTAGLVRVFDLDNNGDPAGGYRSYAALGIFTAVSTLALDATRNRLYAGGVGVGDTSIHTLRLNDNSNPDPGEPDNTFAHLNINTAVLALTLDAARARLYCGVDAAGFNDLRWVGLDVSGNPAGAASQAGGDGVRSIALDAKRKKLYVACNSSNYYDLTDSAMAPMWINDGETSVSSNEVWLRWCLPSAHFVRVEGNGDVQDFYFPVSYTANTAFNEWISADGQRWTEDGTTRAVTLTVKAHLVPGSGNRTVGVWFWESSGASNVNGVMRKEEVMVSLLQDSPTVTPTLTTTPSLTMSPTLSPSPTATPTYTATSTLSATPTSTSTWTHTHTATFTVTATISPTSSPSPTGTPTNSPTPTATSTWTHTHTATFTATLTATPTSSPTPTGTSTNSPTATITQSVTPTATATCTASPTSSPTLSRTPTTTPSLTFTPTVSSTMSATLTRTLTATLTATMTATPTPTRTLTFTPTSSLTASPTSTATPTTFISRTPTPSGTVTATPSETPDYSPTPTITASPAATVTCSRTVSPTNTLSPTATPPLPPTGTPTPAWVLFLDKNQFRPGEGVLTIKVGTVERAKAKVMIFSLSGRMVRKYALVFDGPGYMHVSWDGCNSGGQRAASGIYYIALEIAGRPALVKKVLLIH